MASAQTLKQIIEVLTSHGCHESTAVFEVGKNTLPRKELRAAYFHGCCIKSVRFPFAIDSLVCDVSDMPYLVSPIKIF